MEEGGGGRGSQFSQQFEQFLSQLRGSTSLDRTPQLILNSKPSAFVAQHPAQSSKGSSFYEVDKQPCQMSKLINRQQLKVQNLEQHLPSDPAASTHKDDAIGRIKDKTSILTRELSLGNQAHHAHLRSSNGLAFAHQKDAALLEKAPLYGPPLQTASAAAAHP